MARDDRRGGGGLKILWKRNNALTNVSRETLKRPKRAHTQNLTGIAPFRVGCLGVAQMAGSGCVRVSFACLVHGACEDAFMSLSSRERVRECRFRGAFFSSCGRSRS